MTVYEFWCPACGKGGSTPHVASRAREGCPACGGTLEWGNAGVLPLPAAPGPELFGVGPDEVLWCPTCRRGGPARLAPRRADGVFQCPLCAGLLTLIGLPAQPPQPEGPFVVIETEYTP